MQPRGIANQPKPLKVAYQDPLQYVHWNLSALKGLND